MLCRQRRELKGDCVSLSVFDNAASITQDGDIMLFKAPVPVP